jgi:alpha-mannosidase
MFTHKEPAKNEINGMICDSTSIENELIKLTFDRFTGALISYYDKTMDKELLAKDTEAAVYDDSDYDTWAHGIKAFDRKIGQFKNVSVTNIENGPVRSTMRVVMNYNDSLLCQDYMILSNDKRVTVKARVDFREKHKIFKIIVPVNVTEPKAYCEIPYGYIERKTDGDEQSGQKWMAVVGKNGGLGFANTSKYSFSVSDNVFALTILRTAIYADHFGDRDEFVDYMDLGVHDFIYTMFPYESLEASAKNAYELNMPARHIIETFHHGKLGGVLEGIYVSSTNIIVTAIKDAEDENGTILRAYESGGEDTDVVITSPLWNVKIDAHFGHNEFKTFKIAQDGTVTEVDLLER